MRLSVLEQQLIESLELSLVVAQDHRGPAGRRFGYAPDVALDGGRGAQPKIVLRRHRSQNHAWKALPPRRPLIGTEVYRVATRHVLTAAPRKLDVVLRLSPYLPHRRLVHIAVHKDECVDREKIENR